MEEGKEGGSKRREGRKEERTEKSSGRKVRILKTNNSMYMYFPFESANSPLSFSYRVKEAFFMHDKKGENKPCPTHSHKHWTNRYHFL